MSMLRIPLRFLVLLTFVIAGFCMSHASVFACGDYGNVCDQTDCSQVCGPSDGEHYECWYECYETCYGVSCGQNEYFDGYGCVYDPSICPGPQPDPTCEDIGMVGTYPNCSNP